MGKGSFEVVMEYGSMVDVGRCMVAEEARESDIDHKGMLEVRVWVVEARLGSGYLRAS